MANIVSRLISIAGIALLRDDFRLVTNKASTTIMVKIMPTIIAISTMLEDSSLSISSLVLEASCG